MEDISGNHAIGPESGRILLRTGRAGLAARAGHDLTIEVTRWSAQATVPGDGALEGATVTAELDLTSLAVTEGTGGAKPLTDKDRKDIEGNARKALGAGAVARFESSKIIPSPAGGGTIEGTLTLNGQSRPARLAVAEAGPGRFRATATVKQTDFGITPFSGFFGALKLQDEIGVEVDAGLARGTG
ncbi:MAG: YceI family protein [Streptosporangiales bacterium]|nr:YceI family protein [Streptosporangiales bacterium]